MKIFNNIFAVALLVVVAPVASNPARERPLVDPIIESSSDAELSGQIIVGYAFDNHDDRASRRVEASTFVSETLAKVRDGAGLSDCNIEAVYESIGDTGGFDVFDVGEGNEEVVMQALLDTNSDLIAYVQPDYIVHTAAMPNDPLLEHQWMIDPLKLVDAWDISTGSPSVTIGVCDSGIDVDHPDLAGNMLEGYNAVTQVWGGDFSTKYGDDHGTKVSGCAAAIGNNGIGVTGVGWNFSHRHGMCGIARGQSRSSILADCVRNMCEKDDVKVVNLSFTVVYDPAIYAAADHCRTNHDALLVHAAGNDQQYIVGDNDLDSIIFVGATLPDDTRAGFSNFGPLVDLWAPGNEIAAPAEGGGWTPSFRGTSAAAPIVAGVAALIWSVDPELSPDEVEAILKQSCDQVPSLDELGGYGRVNALEALKIAAGINTLPPTTPPVCDEELVIELMTDDYPFGFQILIFEKKNLNGPPIFIRNLYESIDCYTSYLLSVPGLCKEDEYFIQFSDRIEDGWLGGTCSDTDKALRMEPHYTCSNDFKTPFLKGTWNDQTVFYLSGLTGTAAKIDFKLRDCTQAGGKATKAPKTRTRKKRA